MTRRQFLAGLSVMPAMALGCGSDTRLVKVSGKVYIDGKLVTHGKVQVAPAGYRPAIATIGPDGVFTFGTHTETDGIAVGTHPAAVIGHEQFGKGREKWHVPKRYMSTDSSGLTVTIDEARSDLVIELTWKDSGNKEPFIEVQEKE